MIDDTTLDGFLGGRVMIRQPRVGYRAATDPVLLAACVPAKAGELVLELGCGVGVASLCLLHRISGVRGIGIEVQPDYAALAVENAARSVSSFNVIIGDLSEPPTDFATVTADHVMMNPPFFDADAVTAPSAEGKVTAHVEHTPLEAWIDCGLRRLKPRGTLSIIHLTERLPDILRGLDRRTGDIRILPLGARQGRPAKRVIVQATKGAKRPLSLLPPLVIHSGSTHAEQGDGFSDLVQGILADGKALPI